MAKKSTLAIGIIIIIILLIGGYFLFIGESVTVYIDGENVTSQATISPFAGVNSDELNKEICTYTFEISYFKWWTNRYCRKNQKH